MLFGKDNDTCAQVFCRPTWDQFCSSNFRPAKELGLQVLLDAFQNVFTLTDAIAILFLVCFRTVAPAWILNSTLMHSILVPQSSVLAGHPRYHPGAHQNLPTHPSQTQHVSGIPGLLCYFVFSQVTVCVSIYHGCKLKCGIDMCQSVTMKCIICDGNV